MNTLGAAHGSFSKFWFLSELLKNANAMNIFHTGGGGANKMKDPTANLTIKQAKSNHSKCWSFWEKWSWVKEAKYTDMDGQRDKEGWNKSEGRSSRAFILVLMEPDKRRPQVPPRPKSSYCSFSLPQLRLRHCSQICKTIEPTLKGLKKIKFCCVFFSDRPCVFEMLPIYGAAILLDKKWCNM